jgi:hypothetical protein
MTKRLHLPATSAALLLAVALCADAQPQTAKGAVSEPEKALRQRVTEYWKVRMAGDLRPCHGFYEKAFRDKYSPEVFARDFRRLNRFAPEFVGIEKVALESGGKKAIVRTRLRTKPAILEGRELLSVNEEVWLLEDGVWRKGAEPLVPNV